MKEIFGKNEASGLRRKKSVIMIISILAVAIFIGAAIQPAVADSLPTKGKSLFNKDVCLPCKPKDRLQKDPICITCSEAITFAIEHMIKHVNDNLKPYHYPLKTMDAVLFMIEGLNDGLKMSGFKLEIDQVELKEEVIFWVDRIYGEQEFDITKFLAVLGGISIGITAYLLTLCNDEPNISLTVPRIPRSPIRNRPRIPRSPIRITSRFHLIIVLLHLLGL